MTEAHITIGALRKTYGQTFAPEFRSDDTLTSLLQSTGTASVDEYLEHSKRGRLIVGTSSDVVNAAFSRATAMLAAAVNLAGTLPNPISHLIDANEDEDLSSLRKDRTGVDNTIWVSPRMGSHAARIKIAIDPPDALTPGGKTATMTIQKPHAVTGEAVPTHIIRQAEAFIQRNHEVLLRFWNGEIDTGEMLDQIQKPLKAGAEG
jgi:hypothetical protein